MAVCTEKPRSFCVKTTNKENGSGRKYCDLACAYIGDHLHKRIRAQDVAAYAGISYNYLSKLFPQYLGMGLTEYINREKIRYAEQLLTEGFRDQAALTETVGMEDIKYFRRLFRRYSGVTITQYRQALQSKGLSNG